MTDSITLRERLANIIADWTQPRREVRHTAVGWQPPGCWQHECGDKSASGTDEYYRVTRHANKWNDPIVTERNQDE